MHYNQQKQQQQQHSSSPAHSRPSPAHGHPLSVRTRHALLYLSLLLALPSPAPPAHWARYHLRHLLAPSLMRFQLKDALEDAPPRLAALAAVALQTAARARQFGDAQSDGAKEVAPVRENIAGHGNSNNSMRDDVDATTPHGTVASTRGGFQFDWASHARFAEARGRVKAARARAERKEVERDARWLRALRARAVQRAFADDGAGYGAAVSANEQESVSGRNETAE